MLIDIWLYILPVFFILCICLQMCTGVFVELPMYIALYMSSVCSASSLLVAASRGHIVNSVPACRPFRLFPRLVISLAAMRA